MVIFPYVSSLFIFFCCESFKAKQNPSFFIMYFLFFFFNFQFTNVAFTFDLLVEPTVRTELMEQIPPIAIFLQESRPKFPTAFFEYLMPIVVRYLTDVNNQVGKIDCELNSWKTCCGLN